jgi:beta-ribofuranosylaminobenzene 5'-phosphate synthase
MAIREYVTARLSQAKISNLHVHIKEAVPQHVGLGSKTSVALAATEAALLAAGRNEGRDLICQIAGRGGSSGVGVNTYFVGGLLADGGHESSLDAFQPSSRRDVANIPQPIYRLQWPSSWPVCIIRPGKCVGLNSDEEAAFFERSTPLGRTDCALVAFSLCFELPASILSMDFDAFRQSLQQSRKHGFKAMEIATQPEVRNALLKLDNYPDVAGTMSSFGPSIIAISRDHSNLGGILDECDLDNWAFASGNVANSGRIIEIE